MKITFNKFVLVILAASSSLAAPAKAQRPGSSSFERKLDATPDRHTVYLDENCAAPMQCLETNFTKPFDNVFDSTSPDKTCFRETITIELVDKYPPEFDCVAARSPTPVRHLIRGNDERELTADPCTPGPIEFCAAEDYLPGGLTWSDNCAAGGTVTPTKTGGSYDECDGGSLNYNYTGPSDGCGNEAANLTVTVGVNEGSAVYSASAGVTTAECNTAVPWTLSKELCGATTSSSQPPVTAPTACPSPVSVPVTATGDCSEEITKTIDLYVTDTQGPVLDCSVAENCPASTTVGFCDGVPEGPPMTLPWTDNCQADGIVERQDVSGGPADECGYTLTYSYPAPEDDCGNDGTGIDNVVYTVSAAPVTYVLIPPDPLKVTCDTPAVGYSVNKTVCSDVTTTSYTEVVTKQCDVQEVVVPFGEHCGDDQGSATFIITVEDNDPPKFDCVAAGSSTRVRHLIRGNDERELVPATEPATDSCTPGPIEFCAAEDYVPGGLTWSDNCAAGGTVTPTKTGGSYDECDGGSLEYTYDGPGDGCGNDAEDLVVTVDVRPGSAVYSASADVTTAECNTPVPWTLSKELCGATTSSSQPPVTAPTACPSPSPVSVPVTATGDCSEEITKTIDLYVTDTQGPVLDCSVAGDCPASTTVGFCDGVPEGPPMTLPWTDNCRAGGTVERQDVSGGPADECGYTLTYSYPAPEDDCGNYGTGIDNVVYTVSAAPVTYVLIPPDPVVCGTPSVGYSVNKTVCSDVTTTSYTEDVTITCGVQEVVVPFGEHCGVDQGNATFNITVVDNDPPDIKCGGYGEEPCPQDLTVCAASQIPPTELCASDCQWPTDQCVGANLSSPFPTDVCTTVSQYRGLTWNWGNDGCNNNNQSLTINVTILGQAPGVPFKVSDGQCGADPVFCVDVPICTGTGTGLQQRCSNQTEYKNDFQFGWVRGVCGSSTVNVTYTDPSTYCSKSVTNVAYNTGCCCDTAYAVFNTSAPTDNCFDTLNLGVNNWGWTIGNIATAALPYNKTHAIYAGAPDCDLTKGAHVGDAQVKYNGTDLTVDVNFGAGAGIIEYQIWVGSGSTDYLPSKTDKNGVRTYSSAPGQFTEVVKPTQPITNFSYSYKGTVSWVAIHTKVYSQCYK